MANAVFGLAGYIEGAVVPLLPAKIVAQMSDFDAFVLGSYGVEHGTVLVVLVLLVLALPLLLMPAFSAGKLLWVWLWRWRLLRELL